MNARTDRAASFARLARHALEQHVAEARGAGAVWGTGPNMAWVRWALPGGWYASIALRRHLDWVTGELGLSPAPDDPEKLPLLMEARFDTAEAQARGGRVRLGLLLHDEDRWWPVGADAHELEQTLGHLALQLRVKAGRLLHLHAGRAG